MGNELTLVLGGAKSGKSAFAEGQYSREDSVCYVATGVLAHPDAEMELRIKKHRARRSAKWATVERYQNLAEFVRQHRYSAYLIDDMTMQVTNLFYSQFTKEELAEDLEQILGSMAADRLDQIREVVLDQVRELLRAQRECQSSMVIVSNEVGLGIVPATIQTRILRDLYGEANQLVAAAADRVYLVVSGLSQRLK